MNFLFENTYPNSLIVYATDLNTAPARTKDGCYDTLVYQLLARALEVHNEVKLFPRRTNTQQKNIFSYNTISTIPSQKTVNEVTGNYYRRLQQFLENSRILNQCNYNCKIDLRSSITFSFRGATTIESLPIYCWLHVHSSADKSYSYSPQSQSVMDGESIISGTMQVGIKVLLGCEYAD